MRAIGIHRHGTVSELQQLELPVPRPGPHEVRVRVVCSSVNPADIRARRPSAERVIERRFPLVLGYDVSGVVERVGEFVTGFAPGDEVFGSPSLTGQHGANAEQVLVDHRSLQRKPPELSHAEAAALSLAGVTALECLERALAITPARRLLVHAGAGGVGHLQLQFARALGLRAWATAGSPETIEACRRHGAERVIDYRREDFVALCREEAGPHGMPIIMDNVGGEVFTRSMEALAPLGTLVSIVPTAVPVAGQLFPKAATLVHHVMGAASMWGIEHSQGRALGRVVEMALRHGIRPHISQRWPVRDLALAHRQIEGGHTIGKVVIDVEGGW
ncbi:NADPH2:quinone reductase [Variovorax sp. TBS-050B]|uniref:quinone oxidoreductase family protein n=1 Tax=Variovorax sp. TBS-050B TaxID=2940551 RepID=UPI002474174B|nr:NADP-dependent oxidoreductase [Variovorax sp. TBS-050B]MDH6594023.1 NADPH2:quinone reductase [Variovorax sp. TBS-050B]